MKARTIQFFDASGKVIGKVERPVAKRFSQGAAGDHRCMDAFYRANPGVESAEITGWGRFSFKDGRAQSDIQFG